MKKYYFETRSTGISYMKYINGRRLTGLVTFCVETAFYSRSLETTRTSTIFYQLYLN
jgi:hypothetical protein